MIKIRTIGMAHLINNQNEIKIIQDEKYSN
jgi:hypothetical protein